MKVLTVFNQYLERGGEADAVDLIDDSLRKIADVRRCEFSSADWSGPTAPNMLQQAAWMIHNPRSVAMLRRQQAEFGADLWLVHNVFPVGSTAVYREARRIGVPLIQYIHNYRPFSVNGYLWAKARFAAGGLSLNFIDEIRSGAWQNSISKTAWFALVLWLTHFRGDWRHVTSWIAISEFVRQTFISAGISAGDVFTLPHYWRVGPKIHPDDGEHFLFLGRLVEAKGINVLLDAWDIVEAELGASSPRLLIAGDGPLRGSVAARAGRMAQVTYCGRLSDSAKAEALKGARALIVPSVWWEAAGLVVYEAYDVSRPVLAARSGALPENVVDRETGLTHTPGDARELAAQVVFLERDRGVARRMGENGRRWLEANRSESAWQSRLADVIARTLSRVR